MAEFGKTGLSEIPAPATPQPGVVDNSSAIGLSGASKIIGTLGGIFEDINKQRKQAAHDQIISDHIVNIGKVADSVDQKIITSSEAQVRVRSMTSRLAANNPGLADEILKVTATAVTNAGFGSVIASGTAQEQAERKTKSEATAAGFITVGANEAEIEQGVLQYQEAKLAQFNLEQMQKRLTLTTGQTNLERTLLQRKSEDALINFAATNFPAYKNRINEAMRRLNNGEIDEKEARQRINDEYAVVDSFVSINALAESSVINNIARPFSELKDIALKEVSGEYDVETAKNKRDKIDTEIQLALLNDPQLGKIQALIKILGAGAGENKEIAEALIASTNKYLKILLDPDTPAPDVTGGKTPDTQASTKALLDINRKVLGSVNSGGAPNTTKEERAAQKEAAIEQVNRILDGVAQAPEGEDATKWGGVVNFFASPEFGQFASSGNLNLSEEKMSTANEAIQREYVDVLIPLLRDEFEGSKIVVPGFTTSGGVGVPDNTVLDTPENVSIKFDGAGVVFVSNGKASPLEDREIKNKVKSLNKEIAPHINRFIRATAHLSKTTDYKKIWDDLYAARLFPGLKLEGEGDTQTKK